MKITIQYITLILMCLFYKPIFAQETDFFDQIKDYDLSIILTADKILIEDTENTKEELQRAEILGFIGNDYQRFQIHFISVIKNPVNSYEYFAYGKTKVKETICSFQGIIKITNAKLYKESDIPTYKQGYTICEVLLFEDSKQNSTGFISGTLTNNFVIDTKGVFRYDALSFWADGFYNNQFIGAWTSYKNKGLKECHWGDYRIPKSNDLDIGAGEFSVNEKYLKNGWQNYKLAWGTYPETDEVLKARLKEEEQWWK